MQALEGYGSTQIWGFSPCIDMNLLVPTGREVETNHNNLQEDIPNACQNNTTLTILLMGSGDARHVIKTVARNWRVGNRPLHFYIMEPQASILARQMLFFNILWNPNLGDVGIQEKAELFCQIYGNILVKEKVYDFIRQESTNMIRWVTDESGPLSDVLDFSHLKFREKDDLEFVFKFWRDDSKSFDAKALWEYRSQSYLKRRYDSRENVIDWDYHMKLLAIDKPLLSIIHKTEYTKWRMHGIAFESRDSVYNYPNKSMATVQVLKQDGVGCNKWGYFSDIAIGPYLSFGIDTEAKELLKTENDKRVKASQDISLHNILSFIHEFEKNSYYHCTNEGDGLKEGENKSKITVLAEDVSEEVKNLSEEQEKGLKNVKISFLPCDPSYLFVRKKTLFQGKFDRIFISNALAHRVGDASSILESNGKIIVESARFMPDLTREQVDLFTNKIIELGNASGLKRVLKKKKNELDEGELLVFEKV